MFDMKFCTFPLPSLELVNVSSHTLLGGHTGFLKTLSLQLFATGRSILK